MKKFIVWLILCFPLALTYSQGNPVAESTNWQRKNSVYIQNFVVFPNIYFDRIIPLNQTFGLIPRIGIGFINPVIGLSFYYGNKRHIGELGASNWEFQGFCLNANYRYLGKKGLLLKIGVEYIPEEEAHPIIGVGYSF